MSHCQSLLLLASLGVGACSPGRPIRDTDFGFGPVDAALPSVADFAMHRGGQEGCGELEGCYTVYAHGDHVLYRIDLQKKLLVEVGPFRAPMVMTPSGKLLEDSITDFAVAPDDTLYGISHTNLYTVNPGTGQVKTVGPVTLCGVDAVAMTFATDGTLYVGDFKGAFCKIDPNTKPPKVTQITATLGANLALSGDLVAVGDGTMYGTAYDTTQKPTETNNLLVKINPATGRAAVVGTTGFPKLFGAAFAMGQVFGFTHDGSGNVVLIDPKTGQGKLYNSFSDPTTKMPISFAGAGVNAKVDPTIP